MIKLSIIIPHFNSLGLLKKLLETIPLNDEIQIIVVDDKSDQGIDELNSLINNSKYRNMLFLKNDTNKKGAGLCRNIGLKVAEGQWILFADSDDFFVDGFFEHVSGYFNSNYEVIFFTPTSLEVDTRNISNRHLFYEKLIKDFIVTPSLETETFLRYRFGVPWSKLIKRDFLKRNEIYFDEVMASNDIMFSTKLGYYMQKFHVTRDVIYCVTRSRGTLTTNMSEEIFNSRLMVFIDYCKFLKKKLTPIEVKMLNLYGSATIVKAIRLKLGIKKVIYVYLKLKENNIKVFDLRLINPIFTIKKVIQNYTRYKRQKKYLSK
jgi:glycosyltransferase involved in cell wall biosynthesis